MVKEIDLTKSPSPTKKIAIKFPKRLNNKQHQPNNVWKNRIILKDPSSNLTIVKPQQNFLDALNEYKELRINRVSSTTVNNNNNVINQNELIAIDDDEIEDGEIVDDDVTQFVDLVEESFIDNQVSRNNLKEISQHEQPIFYEDKDVDKTQEINIPLYHSYDQKSRQSVTQESHKNGESKSQEDDDDVICLDNTQSDDSVIIISEHQLSAKKVPLSKPTFLSPRTINDLFEKIPTVVTPKQQQKPKKLSPSPQRLARQKERFAKYKQMKKALQKNDSNQFSSVTSSSPLLTTSQKPSTSTGGYTESTTKNQQTIEVPNEDKQKDKRIILIDGSNVAIGYTKAQGIGKKNDEAEFFSAEALKTSIDYFEKLGFQVKAFVPEYRCRRFKSSNQDIMLELKESGKLIPTPSKAYDDRILLESAIRLDAAIVSNDLFRDFRMTQFKEVMDKRQIRFNWVFNEFILADDPNGRAGPKLKEILFKNKC